MQRCSVVARNRWQQQPFRWGDDNDTGAANTDNANDDAFSGPPLGHMFRSKR